MNAGGARGEFSTKPITFEGDKLTLNFATSAAGSIRVEVQDANGQAIPGRTLDECTPIYGDELARTVAWKDGSDLRSLAGKPARLRFAMQDADLFAVQFA